MKLFTLHLLATCIAGLFASPQVGAAEPRVVVVFGDSITAGGALPAAEQAQLWVRLVEAQSKGQLRMVNEGKGGRPTDSVKEFEAMLTRQPHADLLVVALGANDARDISDQCVPKAVANLRAMIARARATYGEKLSVLLVGPTNIRKDALGPTRPIANEREAKVRELGTAFAGLAKELKCDFVSLYGVVPEASLTRDGVHPDGAGNEAIAHTMLPKLLPVTR
ncbi:MAG: acyl-CoA thioesterase [Chthoniobacter sp.]|jgi:acyl-CoA thioesterase-1|nr:acyl-CoA thioesterase [Chthoniobacter sp.]